MPARGNLRNLSRIPAIVGLTRSPRPGSRRRQIRRHLPREMPLLGQQGCQAADTIRWKHLPMAGRADDGVKALILADDGPKTLPRSQIFGNCLALRRDISALVGVASQVAASSGFPGGFFTFVSFFPFRFHLAGEAHSWPNQDQSEF